MKNYKLRVMYVGERATSYGKRVYNQRFPASGYRHSTAWWQLVSIRVPAKKIRNFIKVAGFSSFGSNSFWDQVVEPRDIVLIHMPKVTRDFKSDLLGYEEDESEDV